MEMIDDTILKIHEKSTNPISRKVNAGAYHFDKDVWKYIDLTPMDERFNERIITNTINLMIKDGHTFKGVYINQLNEVSYPKDIQIVNDRLKGDEK